MNIEPPFGVRCAGMCLAVGGLILFLFSSGMIATGLFVGLHILGPGLLTFGLGCLGMIASRKIDQRQPISRMLGLGWGIAVALFNAAIVFASVLDQDNDMVVAIVLSCSFGLLAILVIGSLIAPSTYRWYASASKVSSEGNASMDMTDGNSHQSST